MATDPVCGMYVDERSTDLKLIRGTRTYYFCAPSCLESFAAPVLHRRRLRYRLGVAAPAAATIIGLTYLPHPADAVYLAAVLAAVVQSYSAWPFYQGAWEALRGRVGNMDLLVAVATTTAFAYSVATLAFPGRWPGAQFFDASAGIIALMLAGQYLETEARERSSGTLRRLAELVPADAEILEATGSRRVSVGALNVGDVFRVRPGERFPVDGTVREGTTDVEESMLTGEPGSLPKGPGSRVLAGSLNGTGTVEVVVARCGSDTFLSGVGRLLTEAETSQVPMQRLADRIAAWFAPLVLLIGVAASIGWAALGHAPLGTAVLIFVSVTITACPCAFGLATPAALSVGVGRAAEIGVLFQGRDSLERAARVDRIYFDKTGTLTGGRPILTEVLPARGITEAGLLAWAASVEAGSEHPLAKTVVDSATMRGVPIPPASDVHALPGRGVEGRSGDHWVAVTSTPTTPLSRDLAYSADQLGSAGHSWSVVEVDSIPIGLLGFSDRLAPGAVEAVRALMQDGIPVGILTGDREAAARMLGRELGVTDVHAGLEPAGKLEVLRADAAAGRHPAFVGDGINDAPALMGAELGIAVGTGTDVARAAGHVLLVRSELPMVPVALRLARATVAKVRGNLLWALGYNAVLLPIAAGALVPWLGFSVYQWLPLAGAAAMALSSTLVVTNSLSLRRTPLVTAKPRRLAGVGRLAHG
jgi:Cu+-exporting ATPase